MDFHEITHLFDGLGGVAPAVGATFDCLNSKELKAIQSRFKSELPETVNLLLSNFGAFCFEEYAYYTPLKRFPTWYSKSNRGIVGTFFGKPSKNHPKAKAISLLHQFSLHPDDFTEDFLPIADDGGGNIMGVRLASREFYLWIHDAPEGKEYCYVNRTIDDWLRSLEK